MNTTYKVAFYRCDICAKEILEKMNCLSDWSSPDHPQDLAFFKGNQCWFYSVGHEKIAAVIHATDSDLDFLEKAGLASRAKAHILECEYFNKYDEIF